MTIAEAQEKRLAGLHPVVRRKAELLIAAASSQGIKIVVTQGTRTIKEQAALYAQGRETPGKIVTNAKPGFSYHNFGLAFDIAVVGLDGKITWDAKVDVDHDNEPDYIEVGQLGEELGLEWGGRFKSLVDLPHFQYTFGLTLSELRAGKTPPEGA